jgi:hypothetical protein
MKIVLFSGHPARMEFVRARLEEDPEAKDKLAKSQPILHTQRVERKPKDEYYCPLDPRFKSWKDNSRGRKQFQRHENKHYHPTLAFDLNFEGPELFSK